MTQQTWLPAGAAFVCQAGGIGMLGVYGFFVQPLASEFETGLAVINLGPVFILMALAFVGPLAGRFIDTRSIRDIMLLGVVIAVTALLLLTRAQSLVLIACCFMGFAIGQAMYGPLVLNSLLIKVYRDRVARALAIAAMGVSFGTVCWPFVAAWLMDNFYWRETLAILATTLLLVVGFSLLLGVPRHLGVAQDSPPAAGMGGSGFLRSSPVWLIGSSASVIYNVALTASICYVPHFTQLGFSGIDVAALLASGGVAGLTGKLLVAAFADRWRAWSRIMAVATVILMGAGFLLLLAAERYFPVMAAVAMIGGAGGAFIPLHPFLNSSYYRPELMGRVHGAQAPMMLPLGLVAAPTAGYAFDVTGSYQPAFWAALVLLAVSAALLLAIPRPVTN